MTLPTKIVVIGAGSASFGENTLSALMRSKKLRGSTLALVDHNPEMLDIVKRLAERLNREWDAGIKVTAHTSHKDTLDSDTKFVVSAIEVGAREGETIMGNAVHPYTQLLLSAVPDPHAGLRTNKEAQSRGEVPSLINPPTGCPFAPRCTRAMDICRQLMSGQVTVEPSHWVHCHLFGPDSKITDPS
jgi:oligopeptide/dipeptide ABC transporter ATP-binding protein